MDTLDTSELVVLGDKAKDSMESWSFPQKEAYCKTLDERGGVAAFLMAQTASVIAAKAFDRNYVGGKHRKKMDIEYVHTSDYNLGDRNVKELYDMANERADSVLAQLPPLKKALNIIDAETAKRMDKRDALKKRVRTITEEYEDLSKELNLADVDQNMTVAKLRQHIKATEAKLNRIELEVKESEAEIRELDTMINKTLYAGIPGLSDAVVNVVLEFKEREKAVQQAVRRIKEKVAFGDSAAALELLGTFEHEVKLSDKIRNEFAKVLDTLKLSKSLPKPKAKKK